MTITKEFERKCDTFDVYPSLPPLPQSIRSKKIYNRGLNFSRRDGKGGIINEGSSVEEEDWRKCWKWKTHHCAPWGSSDTSTSTSKKWLEAAGVGFNLISTANPREGEGRKNDENM